jgi:hypothetical protein
MKRPIEVICEGCQTILGIVNEVEDEGRPGFFRNVCEPNPMPTRCSACNESPTRVDFVKGKAMVRGSEISLSSFKEGKDVSKRERP